MAVLPLHGQAGGAQNVGWRGMSPQSQPSSFCLPNWSWQDVAINVAVVAGCILVFAAVTAGAGTLMQMGGAQLVENCANTNWETVGKVIVYAGDKLFLVGKYAYFTVAVPVYTICWVIPKWLLTEGIPQVCLIAQEHVITPLLDQMGKIATLIYDCLRPLGTIILDAVIWTWNVLIIVAEQVFLCAEFLFEVAQEAAALFYNIILKPLGEIAWTYVVVPLGNLLLTIASLANEWILQPLGNALVSLGNWVWSSVVLYTTKIVNGLEFIATKVWECAQPVLQATEAAAIFLWNWVVLPVWHGIVRVVSPVLNALVWVAQAIYDLVLPSLQWTYEKSSALFSVVAQATGELIASVQEVFNTTAATA